MEERERYEHRRRLDEQRRRLGGELDAAFAAFRRRVDDELGVLLPSDVVNGVDVTQVRQACPECPVGYARPLCPVCLGAGVITERRLIQYQAELWRDAEV